MAATAPPATGAAAVTVAAPLATGAAAVTVAAAPATGAVPATVAAPGPRSRSPRWRRFLASGLSVLIVAAVFGLAFPHMASYG